MKKIQTLLMVAVLALGAATLLTQTTQALECSVLPQSLCGAAGTGDLENSGIWRLLILIINILTAGVGIVAVGAIAFAGFMYATATDDQNKTKKAIEIIRNTAIGLVVYAFMFAGANFLIPGGIFDTSGGGGGGGGGSSPVEPCTPGVPC